jgi:hypothetical protein
VVWCWWSVRAAKIWLQIFVKSEEEGILQNSNCLNPCSTTDLFLVNGFLTLQD